MSTCSRMCPVAVGSTCGRRQLSGRAVGVEELGPFPGDLGQGPFLGARLADRAVVDVGQVAHVLHLARELELEQPAQDVVEDEGAEIADVGRARRPWARSCRSGKRRRAAPGGARAFSRASESKSLMAMNGKGQMGRTPMARVLRGQGPGLAAQNLVATRADGRAPMNEPTEHMPNSFKLNLVHRPRRLRRTAALAGAGRGDGAAAATDLIAPLFVVEGKGRPEADRVDARGVPPQRSPIW